MDFGASGFHCLLACLTAQALLSSFTSEPGVHIFFKSSSHGQLSLFHKTFSGVSFPPTVDYLSRVARSLSALASPCLWRFGLLSCRYWAFPHCHLFLVAVEALSLTALVLQRSFFYNRISILQEFAARSCTPLLFLKTPFFLS